VQVLHAPALHVSPVGHAVHAWPALPHAAGAVPAWQVVPSQQPWEQDIASQTQAPFAQRWPAAQAGPTPQRHSPPEVQRSLAMASHVAHTQAPPTHS
jgi:hypothetical protein